MPPTLPIIDRRIADLRATHEQIAQNLLELDADVTRQLLDASSSLTGTTAERWTLAQLRLSSLWQAQLALGDLLEQVASERGTRPSPPKATLGRLDDLLTGSSVAVERPGGQRSLTEGAVPTDRLTVDTVIARMSADYDLVVAVVAEIAAVWTLIVPRLAALEAKVAELEAAADVSATARPHELARARFALAEAEEVAHRDPLALSDDTLSDISAMVDRAAAAIRDDTVTRQELVGDLASATADLEQCRRWLDQAGAVPSEAAAKVRPPEARLVELNQAQTELAQLEGDLAEVRGLAQTSPGWAWTRLADLADLAADLADRASRLATAGGGDLAARDELRGRLDAYRAKAHAVGRGEDLDLDRLYGKAVDILYSAPCDLDLAGALVVAYQGSISAQPKEAR